jgi:hypothetical protein
MGQMFPGLDTCPVNVIDDAGGRFLVPRLALLIRQESDRRTLKAAYCEWF